MARTLNRWSAIGRLGKEPEIRQSQNGPIANLSVACSDTWTKDGQKQERTYWSRVVVYGRSVSFVEQYLKKGQRVYVEGPLVERKWTDQSGQSRSSVECVIDDFRGDIQDLSVPSERSGSSPQRQQSRPGSMSDRAPSGGRSWDAPDDRDLDDEIPF